MITIEDGVAKYLLAILLDPSQLKHAGAMRHRAQRDLAAALFGPNAEFVDAEDARALVYEGMRSTIWAD